MPLFLVYVLCTPCPPRRILPSYSSSLLSVQWPPSSWGWQAGASHGWDPSLMPTSLSESGPPGTWLRPHHQAWPGSVTSQLTADHVMTQWYAQSVKSQSSAPGLRSSAKCLMSHLTWPVSASICNIEYCFSFRKNTRLTVIIYIVVSFLFKVCVWFGLALVVLELARHLRIIQKEQ